MAKSFWDIINRLVHQADILIEVLDARTVEQSRNREIEDKITKQGKQIIYVITKSDLAEKSKIEEEARHLRPCVFVSAKEKWGTTILLKKILELSKGKEVTVAVLGYTNVGKSSLINALKGKKSASTSPISGHTKGLQKIRISGKILLMDSPGVYAYMEKDETKLALMGSKDPAKLKDPELVALKIIEEFQNKEKIHDLGEAYNIIIEKNDPEEILEEIALKKKRVKKGNIPDTEIIARKMIADWQSGKLRLQR